jgi:hypothetical protein
VALLYLYCFPYYPKIHSANELPRAYLVKAMVDHGTFVIDDGVARWGSTVDVSPSAGHQYSNKAPGSSMLAVPVYAVAKWVGGEEPSLALTMWICRVFTGVVPTLLFLLLLARFLPRYSDRPDHQKLVLVAYAIGSMAMTYSILFISHQLSAVVVGSGWIFLVEEMELNKSGLAVAPRLRYSKIFAAGLLLGAAPLVDYQALFAGVPIAAWLLWRCWQRGPADGTRIVAIAAVGAALPIIVLLWYHAACFGSPWRTGYDASTAFAHFHQQGFLGITSPHVEWFIGSTVSGDNGLFTLAPWLLLIFPGWWLLYRNGHRSTMFVTAAVFAIYLLFVSSINFWRGGWCVGPRYITVMLPFLLPSALAAVTAISKWRAGQAFVAAMVLVAATTYSLSSALFPHFPERFHNPLYDVSFALLRDGAAAPNVLSALGVAGTWSLLPYLFLAGTLVLTAIRRAFGIRTIAYGLLLAAVILGTYRWFPRANPADIAAYRDYVLGAMPTPQPLW